MSDKATNKRLRRRGFPLAAALFLAGMVLPGGAGGAGLPDPSGGMRETTTYRATHEDTLLDVARRFSLGYVEIVAANPGTDPWIPGEGTNVVLPTVHLPPEAAPEGIVINLADMRLYYFAEPGGPMQSFPIGIGREGLLTPLGSTTVVRKNENPTWRPTPRMRAENPELPEAVPAGPDNPLGNRAMYLGWPQYLIHGTNKPLGIGRRTSSGCVRMYPEDVEYLFDRSRGRHQGDGGRPADQARLDRRRALHGGVSDPGAERPDRGLGRVRPDPRQQRRRPGARGGRRQGAHARLEPDPPGDHRASRLSDPGHPLKRHPAVTAHVAGSITRPGTARPP